MKLICMPAGPLSENIYLYYDENTLDGIIVDPGGSAPEVIQAIKKNNINLRAIFLTHGHFDHIGAVAELRKFAEVELYAEQSEKISSGIQPSRRLQDGDVTAFNDFSLKMIHTPGHTCGSCCYYDEKNEIIFTGDTLFYHDIGRTDLPTGNYDAIINSVKNKLFTLPDNAVVYPGHGQGTTIGGEKQNNPYVR